MSGRIAAPFVRTIVRCYPTDFRARYAAEVEESTLAIIQRSRARGTWAFVATMMRALLDLARSVMTERGLARLRGGPTPPRRFGMGTVGQDVRNAVRQAIRNPGFSIAGVLTLSLALGGVTAVLTIADPILFRPLPFRDSDRIVQLGTRHEGAPSSLFGADYVRLLEDRGGFASFGRIGEAFIGFLSDEADAQDVVSLNEVSPEFFDVFGVEPVIGRRFTREEHRGANVVIITDALWRLFYQSRPDIVGQTLTFKGSRPRTFQIVGVLPRRFLFPPVVAPVGSSRLGAVGVTPSDDDASIASGRRFADAFARMKPGVTDAEALATMQRAMTATENAGQAFQPGQRWPTMTPIRTAMYESAERPMFMLLTVTAFVLLLASANLAHLFLARIAGRARELDTRRALGASNFRVMRMLVVEAGVVAVAGAAGALVLGSALKNATLRLLPPGADVYRAAAGGIDVRVVALVALAAALSLGGFGLLPALAAARRGSRDSLVVTTSDRSAWLKRGALVVAQTATAVAIVLTAVLLASTFARLAAQDLGFRPDGIEQVTMSTPANTAGDTTNLHRINLEMKRRIEAVSGAHVALAGGIPGVSLPIGMGRVDVDRKKFQTIGYPVSAEFLEVFGLRLTRGRWMSAEESMSDASVAVIDERAAALSWPGKDPIGQQMQDSSGALRTVIGVVAALQTQVFSVRFQRAVAFVPLPAASKRTLPMLWRGDVSPAVAQRIRAAAKEVDPQGDARIGPLNLIDRQLAQPRFLAMLLGALGALAIALTVVGLYGVVSHGVAHRTREMGIRIALGAEAMSVARLVVSGVLKPAALGVALGLALSLWWTETLRSLLYGFTPHDPRVFAGTGFLVLALVVLACVLPVRRATRVDPLIALKSD